MTYPADILVVVLCVVYAFVLMCLLNNLHKNHLLMENNEAKDVTLFFLQDIFDVFWLLIAWFPLTLFTAYSVQLITSNLTSAGLSISQFKFFIVLAIPPALLVEYQLLKKFHNNNGVWSAQLISNKPSYCAYYILGGYGCILVAINVLCIIYILFFFAPQGRLDEQLDYLGPMSISAVTSCLICLAYIVMYVLSDMSNSIRLHKKAAPFDPWIFICVLAIIAFTALAILNYLRTKNNGNDSSVQFLFGSLLIPIIAIVIQVVHMPSPDLNFDEGDLIEQLLPETEELSLSGKAKN